MSNGSIYQRPNSSVYWMQYRLPSGERVRKTTGTATASEAQAALEAAIASAGQLSFVDAVEHFFTTKTLKPTTVHQYRNSLRVLDPLFRHRTLSEITSAEIRKFANERRREVSDASVRRDLAFLSSLIAYCQETLDNAPDVNPVKAVSKKHLKEIKRTTWLTELEAERLDRACTEEWHRLVINLAISTGLRHGEIRHLEIEWIDFERRQIHLPARITKNGLPRSLPIPVTLADTLKAYCARTPGPYLFGGQEPYTTFQNFFSAACRRAGLKGIRFHDLRHTFASWWVQRGGNIYQLQKLLGHSSVQVTERYAHLATAELSEIMDTLFGGSMK
jgi:integrase/recombinase XerD